MGLIDAATLLVLGGLAHDAVRRITTARVSANTRLDSHEQAFLALDKEVKHLSDELLETRKLATEALAAASLGNSAKASRWAK